MTDEGSIYSGRKFSGMSTLRETIPAATFEDCEFKSCRFVESRFDHCRFVNCTFKECVLSAVDFLECRLSDVSFLRCKAIGLDWTKVKTIQGMQFVECQTSYSNFKLLAVPALKMVKCEVQEVQFNEADLSAADFKGSDLAGSVFFKTNLAGADFRDARNYNIDVKTCGVRGSYFRLPEALSLLGSLEITID